MADDNEKGAQTPAPPAQQDGATTAKATKKAVVPEPEKRIDETVPGGRYIVGDKVVDATGKVLGDA